MVGGVPINNPTYDKIVELVNEEGLTKIETPVKNYVTTKKFLESQKELEGVIALYDDAPAINAELGGIITNINNVQINSIEKLEEELTKYSPGNEIEIKTIKEGGEETKKIVLGENPEDKNSVWLGIGFFERERRGVFGKIYSSLSSFKKEHIYYQPEYETSIFVYDLLWWIVLINLAVALFNMLPLGFLDGGRFFYLTVLSLTKSKKNRAESFYRNHLLLIIPITCSNEQVGVYFLLKIPSGK